MPCGRHGPPRILMSLRFTQRRPNHLPSIPSFFGVASGARANVLLLFASGDANDGRRRDRA
jgi:hypothetical protein